MKHAILAVLVAAVVAVATGPVHAAPLPDGTIVADDTVQGGEVTITITNAVVQNRDVYIRTQCNTYISFYWAAPSDGTYTIGSYATKMSGSCVAEAGYFTGKQPNAQWHPTTNIDSYLVAETSLVA